VILLKTDISILLHLLCTYDIYKKNFKNIFRLSQNCEKLLLASCPSVCPHETTWLPLDGSSGNFTFGDFSKIYQENSSSVTIWQEWRALSVTTFAHLREPLSQFLKYEIFRAKVVETKNILISITFFPKIVPFIRQCGKIWQNQTGHGSQHNTAHAHCTLDT
jgi:hypothetical protein